MYKGHVGKWADVDCDQTFMSVCQAKQGEIILLMSKMGGEFVMSYKYSDLFT